MDKKQKKKRQKKKIQAKSSRPRLTVYRSNKHIYAQIVDAQGKVLAYFSDLNLKKKPKTKKNEGLGMAKARNVGEKLGEKAKKAGIKKVVFDKGVYSYQGQVEALAEGARKNLNF